MAPLLFKQLRAFQERKVPVTVATVRPVITAIQDAGRLDPKIEVELAALAEPNTASRPRPLWNRKSTPAGIRELTAFATKVEKSIEGMTPVPAAPQTTLERFTSAFLPWATKKPETGGYPMAPGLLQASIREAAYALTMNHPEVKALLKKYAAEAYLPNSQQPKPWVEKEIIRARTTQIENRGDETDPFKNLRARLHARALAHHIYGRFETPQTSRR